MRTFTPLAATCCRQPPLEVVQALVEAAPPETISAVANFGNTISHVALKGVASEEVTSYRVENGALGHVAGDASVASLSQDGEGTSDMQENGNGKTPLILALEHGYSPRDIIKALLEKNSIDKAESVIKQSDIN